MDRPHFFQTQVWVSDRYCKASHIDVFEWCHKMTIFVDPGISRKTCNWHLRKLNLFRTHILTQIAHCLRKRKTTNEKTKKNFDRNFQQNFPKNCFPQFFCTESTVTFYIMSYLKEILKLC